MLRLSAFCIHIYFHLYTAYMNYKPRAKDVGFNRGKQFQYTAAFSIKMLEKLIMYEAQLLQSVADDNYTNILALTTFNNEVCHGRIRRCSNFDNSAIRAD